MYVLCERKVSGTLVPPFVPWIADDIFLSDVVSGRTVIFPMTRPNSPSSHSYFSDNSCIWWRTVPCLRVHIRGMPLGPLLLVVHLSPLLSSFNNLSFPFLSCTQINALLFFGAHRSPIDHRYVILCTHRTHACM